MTIAGVPVNSDKCVSKAGVQELVGASGRKHKVNVIFGQDGALWLRFGQKNMKHAWNKKRSHGSKLAGDIFSPVDIAAIRDFNFLDYNVDTDVKFNMQSGKSWHPSSLIALNVRSKVSFPMKLEDKLNHGTKLTFTANKLGVTCSGSDDINVCGTKGLPAAGERSGALIITNVNFQPRGSGAYAGGKWNRNDYTWKGSKYFLYAKLADCERMTSKHLFVNMK
jgi:hypothetical protein